MAVEGGSAPRFDLSGGHLALDLVNTLDDRPSPQPRENLRSYADLVAWSEQSGLLEPAEADHLRALAARQPEQARAVLERAVATREALFRLLHALLRGQRPAASDLEVLNRELAQALARRRLVLSAAGLGWAWDADGAPLDRVLWPVLVAAAELLTGDALSRLRECESSSCDWLFLDTSKNRSRRWCDMRTCGNRAKARRHYLRARASLHADGSLGSAER